ncbi:plasmid stabilization system protein ParE [Flavobacterium sp. 90]|uniref:type II toxin-antitoxin system RelE/ParE family toxin n=1 Tax=unclassified Flavobacterium TaxID=196869 RepID=UPI000EB0347B|nr:MULTISPECIES: type II toxin-antitoxin system RelE/ParE family toxin [unclassified Flavobacterium]RKR05898.1 plasmid stabilization system protein ParE [Flavobacterium sp. 81]TCK57208.1 plasmid stabilization system protein ParE [Flavobacterium sp. 90]
MGEVKKIIWTDSAKNQLKNIFNYYKEKSVQGANNIKNDILKIKKDIHFTGQYQKDEIEPEYRRIIVRDFKILYLEEERVVFIIKIFSSKRDSIRQL